MTEQWWFVVWALVALILFVVSLLGYLIDPENDRKTNARLLLAAPVWPGRGSRLYRADITDRWRDADLFGKENDND